MRLVPLFAVSCLVAVGLSACAIGSTTPSEETVPVVAEGTLFIDWTIDDSTGPNRCNQSSSPTLQIVVVPSDGGRTRSFSQPCDEFATSISLAPGTYSARALLVDAAGNARTTTVAIDSFRILGNDDLSTPIDFPADSFL
jgi:hypothetical protein